MSDFFKSIISFFADLTSPPQEREYLQIDQFQEAVGNWISLVLGDNVFHDRHERALRFLEESLELVQAMGLEEQHVEKIVRHIFSRQVGEVRDEIGGAFTTLAGLCDGCGYDLQEIGETTLNKMWLNADKIVAKQAEKITSKNIHL